jgi:mono/diheme cytochrome c family protein
MKKYASVILVFGWVLSGCSFSLADDVTPAPGYQPQPVAAQAVSTSNPVYPLIPPDPAAGEAVFLEYCAPCHGKTGLGDGPRAQDSPYAVTAIGLPEIVRTASPVEWFNLVTQGNLQHSMPPFPSLTNRQRWDVVAYAFRLSEKQETFSQGMIVYDNQCIDCHGEKGKGDGPKSSGLRLPDFTRQELMASRSATDFFT